MGTSAAPSWISGFLPGSATTSVARVELALDESRLEAGGEPFVALADGGRFSRVLLARVVLGEDQPVATLALKLQKDLYRPSGTGLAVSSLSNREVDGMWQRERDSLQTAASPGIVRAFDLGRDLGQCGPTLFCTVSRSFVRPVCPDTLTPLVVCRDDELLKRYDLEPYSTTLSRFLYAPQQVTENPSAPRFYTWASDAGRDAEKGVVVRRGTELCEDMAKVAAKGEAVAELLPPEFLERFPGGTDPGDLERTLVPLSFYGSFLSLQEMLPLHFDELVDLLGGASCEDAAKMHPSFAVGARALATETLAARLDTADQVQWAFALERGRRFAREVLLLKLLAFAQLCRGLRAHHVASGRPHLGIEPSNVLADFGRPTQGLPARWSFRVCLTDLGAVHRFRLPGPRIADLPPIYLPSLDVSTTFRSPLIDARGFGREVSMQLAAQPAEVERRVRFEARALGSRLERVEPGDVVRIVPNSPLPSVGQDGLAGVVVEAERTRALIEAYLAPGQEFDAAQVPSFEGAVAFYRRFQAPCDLYGLGMLLLRALLVHDQQDVFTVEDAVRQLLDKLALEAGDLAEGSSLLPQAALGLTRAHADVFESRNVLYRRDDREHARDAISDSMWDSLLLLALRMVSNLPDFGLRTHHGEHDPEQPGAIVDAVAEELGPIIAQLRIELIGEEFRNKEIGEACREVMAELGEAMLGGGSEVTEVKP